MYANYKPTDALSASSIMSDCSQFLKFLLSLANYQNNDVHNAEWCFDILMTEQFGYLVKVFSTLCQPCSKVLSFSYLLFKPLLRDIIVFRLI